MLADQHHVRELLARVVQRVTANSLSHEDLIQEGLIHLWRQELDHPGQTQSWYIQNCRFHLLNYVDRSRSLDSIKRWQVRCLLDPDLELNDDSENALGCDDSHFALVCAHDILELLLRRIKPLDQLILRYLDDGFTTYEIAQRLDISHQAVRKHRRSIAALATRLGISLPSKRH